MLLTKYGCARLKPMKASRGILASIISGANVRRTVYVRVCFLERFARLKKFNIPFDAKDEGKQVGRECVAYQYSTFGATSDRAQCP
jgi:hypothetical protein